MALEIERKFLVRGDFKQYAYAHEEIVQGYLSSVPERTVRIRIKGDKAYITIKGAGDESGMSRYEWEKEIPGEEARELIKLCEPGIIDKVRYYIKNGVRKFEVDEFHGENEGLIMAEIELADKEEGFDRPDWLGAEVTGDSRYYNSSLVKYPYSEWKNNEIDTEVKVHDNFSLEFKIGFITSKNTKDVNDFKINTWLFLPNSLDINRSTYKKNDFYRDVKNNIRLITPIYSLAEILKAGRGPLPRLQKALDDLAVNPADEVKSESFVYQVKMFVCILKSALRRHVQIIKNTTTDEKVALHVENYIRDIRDIALQYREMWDELTKPDITQQQREFFLYGDDFLGNITEQYTFQIMRFLEARPVYERLMPELHRLVEDEITHRKKRGFRLLDKDDEKHNSLVISQRNILKKLVESDLFLQIVRKKDGLLAEQFYYSIAAGIAMVFATVVSFFATLRFGNFTTDLFIILVFSYMFKDRIKDMMRYYFSSKLGKKYFDTKLKLSIRKQEIGWIKEAFDYIEESKLPEEVRNIRARSPLVEAENQFYDEKIVLYRKWVSLSREDIEKYKEYRLSGINDITRFNLLNFTQKMDNPSIPLYMSDEEKGIVEIEGNKVYSLYFIVQCISDKDEYYRKYRVLFNRNGIADVSELN